jgi:carbon monoxide dehydrogenase subunit G
MATLMKDIAISVPPEAAWDAICDFGLVHERLVPGFVTATRLEGRDRIVTFANGSTLREPLVSRDDDRRRLVYAGQEGRFTHYNAAPEVFAEGQGCRILWTVDLLPDELAAEVEKLMSVAAGLIRRTLESAART